METNNTSLLFGLLLVALSLLSGCAAPQEEGTMTAQKEAAETGAASVNPAAPTAANPEKQMLIKNAQVKFQVEDLASSTQRIEATVKNADAILVSTFQHQQQDQLAMSFKIKVKPDQFSALLEQLEQESIKLDHRKLGAEDVAMEYIDVQARLVAKRAVEQRYLTLLKQANSIQEVLDVEQQLKSIREEIESADARLKHLQRQTAYSTIELEVYQIVPMSFSERSGLGVRLYNALGTGWQMFITLVVGVCYLWPLLLILAGFWFLRRRRLI
ncbi:DUF4349 domain-containing protein [Rufibacter ruber]|uniref:DUF4349 domain-containing protein n=1 Tax=Rufibacter ruber TaxID=1783499 RepID=UPI00082D319E|nr:DUF4349 domain-containing protein [Rufibacter ruber]